MSAAAYTPGLTVSADATVTKTRRLPLKGEVLVQEGQTVAPDTVVARAELPGIMQMMKVAANLGVDPQDVPASLLVKVGDRVKKGQTIARTKGFFGFFQSETHATTDGTVEIISPVSGNVGIREAPTPVDVTAYIPGVVREVMPGEGVVVEARGAFVQGIFGVGGERRAPLKVAVAGPDRPLTAEDITPDMAGHVLLGGSNISGEALARAAEVGALGVVVGGIVDTDLVAYLGYDIGVAITGHEKIPLTLILTEGFGTIAMANRTFELLAEREGREASFSGATQIRAGVIRPEVIIAGAPADAPPPPSDTSAEAEETQASSSLVIGAPIRIIREPYFGLLATVAGLPPALARIDSGAEVRVLEARLQDGRTVTVPRANVELIQE
jgi:Predicted NADH:ubiquinone oxidoreductase, subunit RnfC